MTVPKRFGVLRFFGSLLKVLAWIVLVVSIISAIGVAIAGTMGSNLMGDLMGTVPGGDAMAVGGGIIAGILLLLGGLLYFLALYVAGESLHLQLAVEENTRLTAALLLRMHQDGQVEGGTPYTAGGFNEPYDT
ncbi:MAG: hypothetical protein WDZ49_06700 [Litorilinea sp.]